ncbi:zinc-binding dehydrogenase [Kitasatospora sp. NPDC056138]|uniref:zinc-binding dehydrogenase n=1 Tax=Kitasatospora sp. NPDC056138 TaxID=3345724 RepID=UPI0035DAAEAB
MRGYLTDPAAAAGLRLTDGLPEPDPAPDEFVLAVRAFVLNHDELNLIRRRPDGWRPGQDVAGEVLRAAADGSGPAEGSRVVVRLEQGGWAERIAVPAHTAAVLDPGVSFEQAATLPIAGVTALRALRHGGSVLGAEVLVTGATGGVGQFAVQLAAASGARVTAQVSSPERAGDAYESGAHQVVTRLDQLPGLGPFQLVLDGIGGPRLADAVRLLAPQGAAILYGNIGGPTALSISDFYAQGWNGRLIGLISGNPDASMATDLTLLVRLVAAGRLNPRIGLVQDWERTADALTALARRELRGKAVLTLPAAQPTCRTGYREPLLDHQV